MKMQAQYIQTNEHNESIVKRKIHSSMYLHKEIISENSKLEPLYKRINEIEKEM